ncbi:hypothetical protein [Sedimentisphaera salicampi]|uniref:Lipoprotein n=1 Tax=Sedimentisphaera salicampi TaxID=1941349 RepID=A0A1W6LLD5_9BACT|nr:hypothetical protein [Sedimentisphaera salicampi]ARN56608.1 hypothetical protein STSP1_00995 [Sedimentisphaera salicampi]
MKIKVFVIAVLGLFASAFLSGCGVVSINSMADATSQVTDENIEGRWVSEDGKFYAEIKRSNDLDAKVDDSNIGAHFINPGKKDYELTIENQDEGEGPDSKIGVFNLKLLKADGLLFAEIIPKTKDLKFGGKDISVFYYNQLLPFYNTLLVKDVSSQKIKLAFIEYQKAKEYIPDSGTPYVMKEKSPEYLFLTGSSEELRDFYVKAAEKSDLWNTETFKKESIEIACYDPRAVAIAYANSEMFNSFLKDKRSEHEKADAAGKTKVADAIEEQMNELQKKFHTMAFSGEPADMILEKVSGRVDKILAKSGADRLVSKWDSNLETAEMKDLTGQLASIFNPSDKTLKSIQQGTKNPPIE